MLTEREMVGEVAYKIIGGHKLTLPEFKLALEKGMITGAVPKSDEALAKVYLYWMGQYYEDEERRSSLCNLHPTRLIKEEEGKKTCCAWGIHLDEVKPEKLTRANVKFLRHAFGKAKVKELTGR